MASLKSPCTTSYRSPIEIIPLNCLLFETNGWTSSMREASCGLTIIINVKKHRIRPYIMSSVPKCQALQFIL